MIFATAWNISADLALLAIPIRIIPKMQLPLKRKIVLLCVLCLGVFNASLNPPVNMLSPSETSLTGRHQQVLAAILNRYYNWAHPNSLVYLRWYVGEVATAVYVVNVPACWPLLRKVFKLDNWSKNRTVTSLPTIDSLSHGSTTGGKKLHSVFSTVDEKPGCSESEVHLADVSSLPWSGKEKVVPTWPLGVHLAHVNASHLDDGDELDVQDGTIVKTVEVSQQRNMRPEDL